MTVSEFWELTPRETFAVIDAALWLEERQQRRDIVLAWHVAALSRTKRLPSLREFLNTKPARPLKGKELERRRKEFREATANLDLSKLARKKKTEV